MNKSEYFKAPDFSLVLGGPLFQLLRRAHLTGYKGCCPPVSRRLYSRRSCRWRSR
jgi:hypothetical protein